MPYRTFSREQDWLLPPSLGELLASDHPVRFVAEFVDLLELEQVGIVAEPAVEGAPSYHPKVLLGAWLYGFMVRVRSSRKLERACTENVAFMWLTGLQRPDHVTLWRFYRNNRKALRRLLKQTVQVATEVGLVDFVLQAFDGSRVAVASPDSLRERGALDKLLAQVEAEIAAMEHANHLEASADGGALPSRHALVGKQALRDRLQHALAVLTAQEPQSETQPAPVAAPPEDQPEPAAKAPAVSPTDPEAVLVKGRHGFMVGYNGQVAVDSKAQIIVAADVVACAGDGEQLVPMLDEVQAMTDRQPQAAAADTGYFGLAGITAAEERNIALYVPDRRALRGDAPERNPYHKEHFVYDAASDTYRCPEGQTLTYYGEQHRNGRPLRVYQANAQVCRQCPAFQKGACTTAKQGRRITIHGQEAELREHAAKMRTPAARQILRQRGAIVEPVFAVFREHLGLVRFLLRGLDNVKAEWRLLCIAHNLRKLWKFWWRPKRLGLAATS
jgi:transposase